MEDCRKSNHACSGTGLESCFWLWNSKDEVYWLPRKLTASLQVCSVYLWEHSTRTSSTPPREDRAGLNTSDCPQHPVLSIILLLSPWHSATVTAAQDSASDSRLTPLLHNRIDFFFFWECQEKKIISKEFIKLALFRSWCFYEYPGES